MIKGSRLFLTAMFLAGGIAQAWAGPKVLLGIDVLNNRNFEPLKGKRVGLVTNHTGMDRKGRSTIDLLFGAPEVKLTALFAPEHGLRGKKEHGQKIDDEKDFKTGLPVYSLYGKTKRPTADMLRGLDAIVFDIQDVGTRFYTYTTTLAYVLEECAKNNIPLYVLDRPNPIAGAVVEGEPLDPKISHFTAYLQLPVRHGMTVGEIAHWYNRTSGLNAPLTVIKMEGWTRGQFWKQTGLKFRPPSPNIRNRRAALLYPGVGCFEAANISVGRGTKTPFEVFGAPWMDGEALAERLNFYAISGLHFKAVRFTPKSDLYQGQVCRGVKIEIEDENEARPFDLFIYAATALRELHPEHFVMRWDEIERVTGSGEFKRMLEFNQSAESILFQIHQKAAAFLETRKPYLLYE